MQLAFLLSTKPAFDKDGDPVTLWQTCASAGHQR